MCNNVFKWFLRAFAVVAALTVTSCADSPDEGDIVIPSLSLSVDGTTVDKGSAATMTFDEGGGTKQFSIKTTGEWEITAESAPQNFALTTSKGEEKYTGKGDETFTVTMGEATTVKEFSLIVKVYASIFGQKKDADTRTIKIMQIKGGVMPEGKVFYFNNFDKEEATQTYNGTYWPYLDQFEGWKNQEGEGAAEVDYDFKSVSARANSKSDGDHSNYTGSGVNNILFSSNGYLTIQNIAVSKTDLCLTFGTERFLNADKPDNNTFKNEEFLVTLSADGQSWSAPIAYSFEEGVDTNGKWNLATANFTLPEGTTTLYIKFATTLSGAHRIDDVKLTDGFGGQAITFEGGGDTPTPPTPAESGTITMSAADIIANGTTTIPEGNYGSQNVDDASTYYTWTMNDVTFAGAKICKATDQQDAIYAGLIQMQGNASDKAKQGFFGNTVDLKKITKVVIVSKNTKYEPTEHLYVGTTAYPLGQNAVTRADLKVDGQTYTETFDVSGDFGYFAVANDKQGAFYVESVTVYYGDEGGDEPTPPTPVESSTITMPAADIIANGTTTIPEGGYGSQNVEDASTYYTWTMNDVTFAGAKICKATDQQDAIYAGLIQMQGNASDKAKQGFFGNTVDLKKITKLVIVSKNTKYEPTEHLYVGTTAYPLGQNAVTRADLKVDGQTYTETFDVSGDFGYFAVANDKQGAFYVESVTVYYGDEGGDEPTPPTPVESGTITMPAADIIANGTTTIPEGSYGSQNVDDASTYYTWTMNDVTFAGAKICKATDQQDAIYAGLIQMQGNASDKAKQGFFGNTVDLKKITKVVIVSKNTKYEPTEHLYVGTTAYPLGQNAVTRADLKVDGQTYTETFDVSGDFGYFAVANDKQGAFYVESVTVYYGGE